MEPTIISQPIAEKQSQVAYRYDATGFIDTTSGEIILRDQLYSRGKPFIRNNHNARYIKPIGEINIEPSLAVPDQTMTIQEIFKRYANGGVLPDHIQKFANYDYDENGQPLNEGLPDLTRMDLADAQTVAERELDAIKDRLRSKRSQAPKKQDSPAIETESPKNDDSKPDQPKQGDLL